jgi:hypothetical protein
VRPPSCSHSAAAASTRSRVRRNSRSSLTHCCNRAQCCTSASWVISIVGASWRVSSRPVTTSRALANSAPPPAHPVLRWQAGPLPGIRRALAGTNHLEQQLARQCAARGQSIEQAIGAVAIALDTAIACGIEVEQVAAPLLPWDAKNSSGEGCPAHCRRRRMRSTRPCSKDRPTLSAGAVIERVSSSRVMGPGSRPHSATGRERPVGESPAVEVTA